MNDMAQKNLIKGFGYLLSSDMEKALGEFKQIVLEDNDTVEVYVALGTLFRKKGELTKAIHVHEGVINRKDVTADVRNYVMYELVHDYRQAGQYGKALDYIQQLIAKDKSPVLLKLLAEILCEMKRFEDAIKAYGRYQKASGKSCKEQIADCFVEMASEASATEKVKILKRGLKLNPNHKRLNRLFAEYLMAQPKKAKGVEAVRSYMENGYVESNADLDFVKGVYFEHLNIDVFIKAVLRKIAAEDDNPLYSLVAADHFHKTGNTEKSISILKTYIDHIGPVVMVVRRYAELSGEDVLFNIYENRDNYQCEVCDHTYADYYEVCAKCKTSRSLLPYKLS